MSQEKIIISKDEYRVRTREEVAADATKPGDHETELEKILTTTSLRKFTGGRLCNFTNKLIKELPFCYEPVDLTDTTFTAKEGGGRLILRIGRNSKTFVTIQPI